MHLIDANLLFRVPDRTSAEERISGLPYPLLSPEQLFQVEELLAMVLGPLIQSMLAKSVRPPFGTFDALEPGARNARVDDGPQAQGQGQAQAGSDFPGGDSRPLPEGGRALRSDVRTSEKIPTNVDYRELSKAERRESSGMSDRDRAVLHLWGIQMTSKGSQDGGVLMNVLETPSKFQPAEVQLAKELKARDEASFGGITGKSLDQEFFGLYQGITGKDVSDRYKSAPIRFAEGPVDMNARITGDNGLSKFENQVLQLWGHSPLFNEGRIDGNILDYALNSENTLENNLVRSDLEALKEADLRSDGVLNGDSLENAFLDTLDHLYLGGPAASAGKTMNDALEGAALRREGLFSSARSAGDEPIDSAKQVPPVERGNRSGGIRCPFLAKAA